MQQKQFDEKWVARASAYFFYMCVMCICMRLFVCRCVVIVMHRDCEKENEKQVSLSLYQKCDGVCWERTSHMGKENVFLWNVMHLKNHHYFSG